MKQSKKDFVSLDEALGFLKYMNYKKPFQEEEITVPTKDKDRINLYKNNQKQPSPIDSHQNSTDQISEKKKKLNKNRAIKRIIQSSFQILDKNYKQNQQNQFDNQQRSSSTQFNIYLKQYNRIIQQINRKQTEKAQKIENINQRNESQLQQIYEYTVNEDYRERLMLLFTKEKISKNNVDMMISTFSLAQTILKSNQMRVQFVNTQQAAKSFKVNEIQNVQYFTQPYIFIVLTVTKDKTKSQEYVYMKFNSQISQDKWDRALYCSFMSKKMKKKDRLFQIQYPVEDVIKKQKQQIKKNTQNYFVQESNIIVSNFEEQEQQQEYFTHQATQNEDDANLISERTNFVSRHRTDDNFVISIINSEQKRRLNTSNNKNSTFKSPFKDSGETLNKKNTFPSKNNFIESERKINEQEFKEGKVSQLNIQNIQGSKLYNSKGSNSRGSNSVKGQNKQFSQTDSIIIDKDGQKVNPNQNAKNNQTIAKGNPFLNLMKIAEQRSNISESKNQNRAQNQLKKTQKQAVSSTDRRIRQIQKINVRGIILQKEKFFFNKDKIIYLFDQAKQKIIAQNLKQPNLQVQVPVDIKNKFLQYWDIDVKNGVKTQKKVIHVLNIKQLFIDLKSQNLVISYGENKQVRFNSNSSNIQKLKQIQEWYNLLKSQEKK